MENANASHGALSLLHAVCTSDCQHAGKGPKGSTALVLCDERWQGDVRRTLGYRGCIACCASLDSASRRHRRRKPGTPATAGHCARRRAAWVRRDPRTSRSPPPTQHVSSLAVRSPHLTARTHHALNDQHGSRQAPNDGGEDRPCLQALARLLFARQAQRGRPARHIGAGARRQVDGRGLGVALGATPPPSVGRGWRRRRYLRQHACCQSALTEPIAHLRSAVSDTCNAVERVRGGFSVWLAAPQPLSLAEAHCALHYFFSASRPTVVCDRAQCPSPVLSQSLCC